ncbi:MAG TPA: transcription antitermination factor NusB [Candidatus Acidoferrum sp.]|nr:transcription antitermination factor NusB [Candidatus Acidoferrum sp.]
MPDGGATPGRRSTARRASIRGERNATRGGDRIRSRRAGRRLALAAVFEAEFGQRTATAILEHHLAEIDADAETAGLARSLVAAVVDKRDRIDAEIERAAPQYPVVSMARIDRALLRCALGEVLHSGTTPARVAIAEWVELARIYSGEPIRRLMNGVLGRIATETSLASSRQETSRPPGPRGS